MSITRESLVYAAKKEKIENLIARALTSEKVLQVKENLGTLCSVKYETLSEHVIHYLL